MTSCQLSGKPQLWTLSLLMCPLKANEEPLYPGSTEGIVSDSVQFVDKGVDRSSRCGGVCLLSSVSCLSASLTLSVLWPSGSMAGQTSLDRLPPLVVFVYGSAWSTGHRSIYCLLATQMAEELNAAVICPDYSTFSKGNVLMMVQDVADSFIWAQENGPKFRFDKDNIVLVGHSAGAHLAAMTTLFLLDTREELLIESKKQQEIIRSLKGVIGMSGVYSIMDHHEHEKTRGIEYISCMSRAMNGKENFRHYSPVHVVKNLSSDKLS
ncbi:hypothetical protein CHARACLAT_010417, partial [Characodon lateralis]|nr:hypothetical protein [Characodon lateralis]